MKMFLIITLFLLLFTLIALICVLIPILMHLNAIIGFILFTTYLSWQMVALIMKRLMAKKELSPSGRAVLITGCDTGFGFATSIEMAKRGWHVFACVLCDHEEGATSLRSYGCTTIEMDVTKEIDVDHVHQVVVRECKVRDLQLWALVNNAGVLTCGEVEWGSFCEFDKVFQVNVLGCIRVTRKFLPIIRKSRGNNRCVDFIYNHLIIFHLMDNKISIY